VEISAKGNFVLWQIWPRVSSFIFLFFSEGSITRVRKRGGRTATRVGETGCTCGRNRLHVWYRTDCTCEGAGGVSRHTTNVSRLYRSRFVSGGFSRNLLNL
jgi:hypothetical protein